MATFATTFRGGLPAGFVVDGGTWEVRGQAGVSGGHVLAYTGGALTVARMRLPLDVSGGQIHVRTRFRRVFGVGGGIGIGTPATSNIFVIGGNARDILLQEDDDYLDFSNILAGGFADLASGWILAEAIFDGGADQYRFRVWKETDGVPNFSDVSSPLLGTGESALIGWGDCEHIYDYVQVSNNGDALPSVPSDPEFAPLADSTSGPTYSASTQLPPGSYNVRAVGIAGNDRFESSTRSITVTERGNAQPTFNSTPVNSINQGEQYTYELAATDPDGDAVFFELLEGPAWLSLNGSTLEGTPQEIDGGTHSVKILATDNIPARGDDGTIQSFEIEVPITEPVDPIDDFIFDLSGDTIGQMPSGWSVGIGDASNFTVQEDSGERYIQITPDATLQFFVIDGLSGTDVESLYTIQGDSSDWRGVGLGLRAETFNSPTDNRLFANGIFDVFPVGFGTLLIDDGSASFARVAGSQSTSAGVKYKVRTRNIGSDPFSTRVWLDSETEPTDWDADGDDGTGSPVVAGAVGIYVSPTSTANGTFRLYDLTLEVDAP